MRNGASARIAALSPAAEGICVRRMAELAQHWPGHSALEHRLATSGDLETIRDHVAVLRFALVFRAVGCQIRFEPSGAAGPDLEVTHGETRLTVEVTRFRPVNPGPELFDGEGGLLPYGNPERDVLKSIGKIKRKLAQATGPAAAIAISNDDEALDHYEVKCATKELQGQVPASIEFVLYGSSWVRALTHRQLYCFTLREAPDDPIRAICMQLEATTFSRALAVAGAA